MNKGWLLWLTGLPGAGKSTLSEALVARLRGRGIQSLHLDGDHFRKVLGGDLGFSAADRAENLRRAGAVAQLLAEGGTGVVAAFVSPYRVDREGIRARFPVGRFAEVFVRCPLDICQQRDPKGLYARASTGGIANFTGVSDPYEEPLSPDLVIDTVCEPLDACLERLEALILRLQGEGGLDA